MAKVNVTQPSGGTAQLRVDSVSDLTIEITPRAYTTFRGTADQLIAEGLIPDGFNWPIGGQRATIEVSGFEHWIFRIRPEGHKGPISSWANSDYWRLMRKLKNQPANGWMEADIHEKKMEIANILYRRTTEWSDIYDKAHKAKRDDKYMAFRTLLLGDLAPRKHGRPSKAASSLAGPAAQ